MKTARKLAAGWLLTLGFMFMTLSITAEINKHNMIKPLPPSIDGNEHEFINKEALYVLYITAKQGIIFGFPTLTDVPSFCSVDEWWW